MLYKKTQSAFKGTKRNNGYYIMFYFNDCNTINVFKMNIIPDANLIITLKKYY